ncbi:hypothetical protein [Shewanella sp. 10N.286.54.B9]|uniref:hypothetical protein n=1 Tax=Shewanella sp. 10N.286.54.B9 TaxID=3229719 RepID=UPI0035546C43
MNLAKILDRALASDNLYEKLRLSRLYCHLVTGGKELIYDANLFEAKISTHFCSLVKDIAIEENVISTNHVLHVISEAYLSGGHTRLCENIASMDEVTPDLLISRDASALVIKRLHKHFVNVFFLNNDDECERLVNIYLKVVKYKSVVIHIHPDDILTTIALNLAKMIAPNLNVYFINHADHLFSYGKSAADCVFQISYRGYEIDRLISDKNYENSFLGIPVSFNKNDLILKEGNKILVAGASYKMKPWKNISLPRELIDFLRVHTSHTVKIVGVGYFDYWWWHLKLLFPKRVKIYSEMSYPLYIKTVNDSDICIDTAPITGGTAFVEMFTKSLYPIALKSGIYGYTPLDQVRVKNLTSSKVYTKEDIARIYGDVILVHSFDNVARRYQEGFNQNYQDIPSVLTQYENDMSLFIRSNKAKLTSLVFKDILKINSYTLSEKISLLLFKFDLLGAFSRKIVHYIKAKLMLVKG